MGMAGWEVRAAHRPVMSGTWWGDRTPRVGSRCVPVVQAGSPSGWGSEGGRRVGNRSKASGWNGPGTGQGQCLAWGTPSGAGQLPHSQRGLPTAQCPWLAWPRGSRSCVGATSGLEPQHAGGRRGRCAAPRPPSLPPCPRPGRGRASPGLGAPLPGSGCTSGSSAGHRPWGPGPSTLGSEARPSPAAHGRGLWCHSGLVVHPAGAHDVGQWACKHPGSHLPHLGDSPPPPPFGVMPAALFVLGGPAVTFPRWALPFQL